MTMKELLHEFSRSMTRSRCIWWKLCLLVIVMEVGLGAATSTLFGQEADARNTSQDEIDFTKARELIQRQRAGEKLTEDEAAYLARARELRRRQAARQAGNPNGNDPSKRPRTNAEPRESLGLKPLSEMTAADRYQGEDGGLYGGGQNEPPEKHRLAAEAELARIEPLNAEGRPDANGQVVLISISMSNATQEFSRFKQLADRDPSKSDKLVIVDCAQGGQAMAEWARPQAAAWTEAERRITNARVTPQQVQVAWIKLANKMPTGELSEHGKRLQRDTLVVLQEAKQRFPNLRVVYLSSRIYAGYATNNLNPEPYAYESAFVARWLIQDQMAEKPELNFAAERGEAKSPLLLWGPYLWADGTQPRAADGLTYSRDDLARDGTHPSESGRDKVARVMLDFFKTNPLTKPWFSIK